MDVHPKYIKLKKAGLLQRLGNAARAFVDGLINAQGFFLNAPLNALDAFFEDTVEIVDKELMLKDAQDESKEEDDGVITLKLHEEEEDWQKKHREIYKEEDDE